VYKENKVYSCTQRRYPV